MPLVRFLLLLLLLYLQATAHGAGERRIALVIGNANYMQGALKNPVNDARDMRANLLRAGFAAEDIVYRENLRTAELGAVQREFRQKLDKAPGAIGLLFYAGHGFQISGENYFPTVDARIESEEDVRHQSLNLRAMLEILARSRSRASLVFLDACRDNPFKRALLGSATGLARSDFPLPSGMLIAYAAKPSQVAFDGRNGSRNGQFTEALLHHMMRPNLPVEQLLKEVIKAVRTRSQGAQEPWSEGSIEGDFAFVGNAPTMLAQNTATTLEPEPAAPAPPPAAEPPRQMAAPPDEKERPEWLAKQAQMKLDFDRLSTYGGAASLQAQRWGQFLEKWSVDNPFSHDDELLRAEAEQRVDQARAEQQRATPSAPGERFRDCADCPELVILPAGKFIQGSPDNEEGRSEDEGPWHEVILAQPMAVGRMEVTRAEWSAFVRDRGYRSEAERGDGCTAWNGKLALRTTERNWRRPGFEQAANHPVVCISWQDVQAYLQWLNQHSGGKPYRLLTESEWEYAARAGSQERFPWGADPALRQFCQHVNGADQSAQRTVPGAAGVWQLAGCDDLHPFTAPAAELQANAFGLHGMLGNAAEWVQDCYSEATYASNPPQDGRAAQIERCPHRVVRGGSWYDAPPRTRPAKRARQAPDARTDAIGFRVMRPL
ncbi:SUMF1/EgtB/PvdO family nonheme iron enzyme [Inhella sp.]|uniref:SUMF1/EgtB/PvdO family nonheme iron enzyme n=1 Tax=Inhella sp. TaxID=1921806 RepID=UPI0035B113D0